MSRTTSIDIPPRFRCRLCGFHTNSRSSMREHVAASEEQSRRMRNDFREEFRAMRDEIQLLENIGADANIVRQIRRIYRSLRREYRELRNSVLCLADRRSEE